MLLASRSGFLVEQAVQSPWVDKYVFRASDWDGVSDKWFATDGVAYMQEMNLETSHVSLVNGEIVVSEQPTSNVGFAAASVPLSELAFRVLVDATLNLRSGTSNNSNNIILDNSIVGTSSGTRCFALGYTGSGTPYYNWKMNGNNGSGFNPTTSIQVFSPPITIKGIFEAGVRPSEGGYVCYTAYNGVDNSVGPVVSASIFGSSSPIGQGMRLAHARTNNYGYVTGAFREIRVQVYVGGGGIIS